jgi:hypothetical protein
MVDVVVVEDAEVWRRAVCAAAGVGCAFCSVALLVRTLRRKDWMDKVRYEE